MSIDLPLSVQVFIVAMSYFPYLSGPNAQVHRRPCKAWTSECNAQLGAAEVLFAPQLPILLSEGEQPDLHGLYLSGILRGTLCLLSLKQFAV